MSKKMSRKLNIIIFKAGEHYIASGVELDIFAQGKTEDEAKRRLEVVLRSELDEARQSGRDVFDLGPAPDSIQSLFRGPKAAIVATDERLVA